jgi:hypothetical protein
VKFALVVLLLTGCALHAPRDLSYQESVSRAVECRMLYPQPNGSDPFGVFGLIAGIINSFQFDDCIKHYGFK